MPTKVYNNVEGHRLYDDGNVVEDITSITLPSINFTSSTIDANGMMGAVDVPNPFHVDAMEFSVAHNNGAGCEKLATPGKHVLETRVVRQKYDVARGEMGHESVKFRVTGLHTGTEKGSIETGNPYGGTDKFSVLRYEEILDGKTVTLIDVMSGIMKINGKDFSGTLESYLN